MFSLKKWFTVADAAKRLTSVFGEEVNEADMLRFALDKHLTLSINFINPTYGKCGKIIHESEARRYCKLPFRGLHPVIHTAGIYVSNNTVFDMEEKIEILEGVWDLPMIGDEKRDIERKYQTCIGISNEHCTSKLFSHGCLVARSVDAELCMLQQENECYDGTINPLKCGWRDDFLPAQFLPDDSVLVVRADALREFEQSLINEPKPKTKSAQTKERRTLLTIIAALCKPAKVDYMKSDAIQKIQRMLEDIGVSLDDKTIRDALNEIPDALEARMK